MNPASAPFILCVLLLAAVFYSVPRSWQPRVLLAASVAYALTWSWRALAVLGAVAVLTFAAGRLVANRRRAWLVTVVVSVCAVMLGLLGAHSGALETAAHLLASPGGAATAGAVEIWLPIGVSFYTLGAISYVVDVHRGDTTACTRFDRYALYIAWFPKLVAGPIERARDFLPQLDAHREVDDRTLSRCATWILLGFFRKIVLAGMLIVLVWRFSPLRGSPLELPFWLIALVLFIYNDFAGYTHIARGVSGLFGLELAPNFRAPFFARSVGELWNRWHISLSRWLRDYVFMPVSMAAIRRMPAAPRALRLTVAAIVTMLVSGLWHGLRWRFVVWGLLAGMAVALSPAVGARGGLRARAEPIVAWIVLLALVVPFALTGPALAEVLRRFLSGASFEPVPAGGVLMLLVAAGVSLSIDRIEERAGDDDPFMHWPVLARVAAFTILLVGVVMASIHAHAQPVLYQFF